MAQITLDLNIPDEVVASLQTYIADNPQYATVRAALRAAVRRFVSDTLDRYPTTGLQQEITKIEQARLNIANIREGAA